MIVAAHQPEFLPYVGFFSKMAHADIFVLADNVQFHRGGYQNRNRIRTENGQRWLTVPVAIKGHRGQRIDEVQIDNSRDWRRKHWGTMLQAYSRAQHFQDYRPFFETTYSKEWERLSPLNEACIRYLKDQLGIRTTILKGSDLGISGSKTDLILDICRKVGADSYLSGPGGRQYLVESRLEAQGVALRYNDFQHPVYEQVFRGFVPNMSVVDLLFNVGSEARKLLP